MSDDAADDNVLNFLAASVESLRDKVDTLSQQMVTKADLGEMVTKADLRGLVTQSDLRDLATKADVIALRGDIERVHLRLDAIERTLSTRLDALETEISRLRSVLYLLAKDQPELLRLLGQGPFS